MTMGPRTAYSIVLTWGLMFSNVNAFHRLHATGWAQLGPCSSFRTAFEAIFSVTRNMFHPTIQTEFTSRFGCSVTFTCGLLLANYAKGLPLSPVNKPSYEQVVHEWGHGEVKVGDLLSTHTGCSLVVIHRTKINGYICHGLKWHHSSSDCSLIFFSA